MKSDLGTLFAVASGGALGALARFGVGKATAGLLGGASAPATLLVNVLGCSAMGYLYFHLAERETAGLRAFLLTGFLGAFTTFSAFALDAALLLRERTAGAALVYVLASILLSLAGFAAGAAIARAS